MIHLFISFCWGMSFGIGLAYLSRKNNVIGLIWIAIGILFLLQGYA